jgi:DNA-binding NarL/FixJ family response regulator
MNPDAGPIRVLIVDDHPVVRRGMSALLASLPGVEVVGEAATGTEALREAQLQRPAVVMMDVQMPAMDGIEATRRLVNALPDTVVLVLTMFEDDDTVFSAMRAGARGYLLKGAEQEEILAALHSVIAGQVVIGPGWRSA